MRFLAAVMMLLLSACAEEQPATTTTTPKKAKIAIRSARLLVTARDQGDYRVRIQGLAVDLDALKPMICGPAEPEEDAGQGEQDGGPAPVVDSGATTPPDPGDIPGERVLRASTVQELRAALSDMTDDTQIRLACGTYAAGEIRWRWRNSSLVGDCAQQVVIRSGGDSGFIVWGGGGTPPSVDNVHVRNIRFEAGGGDQGLDWLHPGKHLVFQRVSWIDYSGSRMQAGSLGDIDDVLFDQCVFVGAQGQGIYVEKTTGVRIHRSVFDDNGRPTIYDHNLYVQYDSGPVEVRDSIFARGGSHGVQMRSGGSLTNSLFWRNPIAVLIGSGYDHNRVDDALVENVVVVESTDIGPGLPRGWGIHVEDDVRSSVVRNNVVAWRKGTWGDEPSAITVSGQAQLVDNVVHEWPLSGPSSQSSPITEADIMAARRMEVTAAQLIARVRAALP